MVTEIDERGRCFLSCIVLVQLLPESDSRVHIMNKKKKVQVSTDGKDTHGPSAKHAPKARAQWKGKRGEQGKMEASMNDAGKELQKEQAAQQSPKTNAKDLAGSTHRGSPLCTSPNEVSISSVLPHQGRSSDACLLPLSQVRSSEPSSISLMKTCEPCDIIVTPQGTHQLDLPVRGEEAAETMMVLQFQDQSKHCLGKGAKETFQDSSSAMNLGSLNGIKETEAENRHPVANSSVPGEPHEQALSALDQVTVEGQSVVSSKTNIPGSLVGRKLPFSDCTIDATSISSQTMLEISLSDSIPKAKELGLFESGQELVPGNNLQGKGSQDLEKREFRAQKERGLKRNNHNNSTTCSEARPQDTACPSARVLEDPSKEPSELFYLVVPAVTDSESPRQSLLTHVSEPVIPAEGKTTSQGSDVALLCSDVFHPVCTPTDNLTLDLREENELLCFTVAPLFPACANEVTLTSGAEAKESNMSEKGSEPEKTAVTMCGPLLEMMGKPVVSLEKGAQASVICPSSPEVQIKDVDRGNGAQQTCEPNWKVGVNSNLANPGQSEDTNCGMTMKPPDTGTHTESSLTCASVPNNKSPVFSSQSCSPCLEFQTRDHRNLPGSQMKRPLDEDRLEPAVPQFLVEHAAHSCPISADKGSKRSKPTLPLTNDSLTTYWLSDKQIGEENIWCIPSTVEEHKEEVPCCPPAAVEQDGTQTVQGLIAELSNLNRLIMNTHKDLETIRRQRHRRGRPGTKYLQRAGFMAKRGKEP